MVCAEASGLDILGNPSDTWTLPKPSPQTFFQLRSLYSEIAAAKKARVLVEEEIAELSTKMRKLLAR